MIAAPLPLFLPLLAAEAGALAGESAAEVGTAALGIAQHLPGGVEGQHRRGVATGVRVVLLDQGPIGGLDRCSRGRGADPQHGIGVTGCSGGALGQGGKGAGGAAG